LLSGLRDRAEGAGMTAAQRLLDRLDGVKRVADGRWMAKCPAHEDKRPSLSIRETDDGRVLLHCYCIYLVVVSESLAAGIALAPEDRSTLAGTVTRITAAPRMVL